MGFDIDECAWHLILQGLSERTISDILPVERILFRTTLDLSSSQSGTSLRNLPGYSWMYLRDYLTIFDYYYYLTG